jgi:hypothetical protein
MILFYYVVKDMLEYQLEDLVFNCFYLVVRELGLIGCEEWEWKEEVTKILEKIYK